MNAKKNNQCVYWIKMHSLIDVDSKENKKEKGVNKNVVKNARHKK